MERKGRNHGEIDQLHRRIEGGDRRGQAQEARGRGGAGMNALHQRAKHGRAAEREGGGQDAVLRQRAWHAADKYDESKKRTANPVARH